VTDPGPERVPEPDAPAFVSRGGLKLLHALDAFALDVSGLIAADFGCSTGGFTDCLLQRGAARVHAIDTAYGELAWKLRQDPRVTVHERSNALHLEPPDMVTERGGVDLVVIDLGWTKQAKALPAAARWLKPGGAVVSLVKPHYEATKDELPEGAVLDTALAQRIAERVRDEIPEMGFEVLDFTKSPVLGGAVGKRRKRKGKGNPEWLVLARAPA